MENNNSSKTFKTAVQTLSGVDYMENGKGDLVPVSNIKEQDLERDDLVGEIAFGWKQHGQSIKDFKYHSIGEMMAFVELQAEKYGVKISKKGNFTLQTFNGKYQLKISISEHKSFNEQLTVAKEIVDECVREWSSESNMNLITLVNSAFDIDEKGNISTARIFELLKMEIKDNTGRWTKAMNLIKDSITIIGSKQYVRLYERDEQGKYVIVPLDIAAL